MTRCHRRRGWRGGSDFRIAPEDVAQDFLIGARGEELVYRSELERVRRLGYEAPERYVIWTSRNDAGADHDIRSVTDDGGLLWIEVKSTTGIDGWFYWPKKEFEKALRERERYELKVRVGMEASGQSSAAGTEDRQSRHGAKAGGSPVLDVAQAMGLWAAHEVQFARGTARKSRWCAVQHRVIDWASRSPSPGSSK